MSRPFGWLREILADLTALRKCYAIAETVRPRPSKARRTPISEAAQMCERTAIFRALLSYVRPWANTGLTTLIVPARSDGYVSNTSAGGLSGTAAGNIAPGETLPERSRATAEGGFTVVCRPTGAANHATPWGQAGEHNKLAARSNTYRPLFF